MELTILKDYIANRPNTGSYSDLQLQKALSFSETLIDLFFDIAAIKNYSYYQFAVCQQAIYILENDLGKQYLTKYQGLSQFSIGNGAVQGTVAKEVLSWVSPLAKAFLKKVVCEMVVNQRGRITYSYTTF